MVAAVAATSQVAFSSERPVAYLVFPALGWAAMRSGRRGATLAIVVTVCFAVWNTTLPRAVHVRLDHAERPRCELYIAVVAVSTLCLAALVAERKRFAVGQNASRIRLMKVPTPSDGARTEPARRRPATPRRARDPARDRAERARDAHEPGAPELEAGGTGGRSCDRRAARACSWHSLDSSYQRWTRSTIGPSPASTPPIALLDLPSSRSDDAFEATASCLVAEALSDAQSRRTPHRFTTCDRDDPHPSPRDRRRRHRRRNRARRRSPHRPARPIEALGGTFKIDSPSGHGTRIAAAIPLAPPAF